MKKSFEKKNYVDNCLIGVDQLHKQESFIEEAQKALKLRCFYLQGWAANGLNFSDDHVENVLGLRWFCSRDERCCSKFGSNMKPIEFTRRNLLSFAQKIFDTI